MQNFVCASIAALTFWATLVQPAGVKRPHSEVTEYGPDSLPTRNTKCRPDSLPAKNTRCYPNSLPSPLSSALGFLSVSTQDCINWFDHNQTATAGILSTLAAFRDNNPIYTGILRALLSKINNGQMPMGKLMKEPVSLYSIMVDRLITESREKGLAEDNFLLRFELRRSLIAGGITQTRGPQVTDSYCMNLRGKKRVGMPLVQLLGEWSSFKRPPRGSNNPPGSYTLVTRTITKAPRFLLMNIYYAPNVVLPDTLTISCGQAGLAQYRLVAIMLMKQDGQFVTLTRPKPNPEDNTPDTTYYGELASRIMRGIEEEYQVWTVLYRRVN